MPYFCFAQTRINTPENLDEAKFQVKEFLIQLEKNLGGEMTKTWNEKIMPLWREMWKTTKEVWLSYIQPKGKSILIQIEGIIQTAKEQIFKLLGKEIEQRKPLIEQEFQKEKKELELEIQERTSGFTESFWGKCWRRFKEIIRQI